MYKILPYTQAKARRLNVRVKPSSRKGKKIDVYDREGNYLTSVGAKGYLDYLAGYLKKLPAITAKKLELL